MAEVITVYTDGSSGNIKGKDGGIGVVMFYKNQKKIVQKAYTHTSNNRMELRAVIEALKHIKAKHIPVEVHSDSQYVVYAFTKNWIKHWNEKRWINVSNTDLWQELLKVKGQFKSIAFIWVKGHADNEYNNLCDKLAGEAKRFTKKIPDLW